MKKESSEVIRNQYVSENEYLKSSINRASLGRSSSVESGMQSPRSRGKKGNSDVSGMEGTGVVMDFIRKFENVGNDSSGDDNDDDSYDDDDDDDDDDIDSDSENRYSDRNDNNRNDDDSVSEVLEIDGDDSDDSDSEEIVKTIEKKTYNMHKNKNIVHLEYSEEGEVEVEAEEEDSDTLDSVKYNSRGTYKSILEEFEDMENENNDKNRSGNISEVSNEIRIEHSETDVEVEVDSSSIKKVFSKGGFEYTDKEKKGEEDDVIDKESDDEKDEEDVSDAEMNADMETKYREIDNSKERRSKSDETASNSDSNLENSDDYLMLHQNNVDDVLKNLLNDFEIKITSEKLKKKTVKNITKKGIKYAKKKKFSSSKNSNLKSEMDSRHTNKLEKKNKKDKTGKSSSEKNKKTNRSIKLLKVQNEENGFVINLFQNILSHKNTIFCFTLAVTMHYFIFSGILKLV